ncbi:hypothetical protein [Roseibium sp. M-1]
MTRFLTLLAAACLLLSQPALAELRDWKAEYQRGLDAARAGDFKKAVEILDLVNNEVERNPGVVFNFALASARNGNLFRAAMLFRQYLVMVPDAANADGVRKEIARLDEEIRARETDLFRRALAAATEFPDVAPESTYSTPKKTRLFSSIAREAEDVGNAEIAAEANKAAVAASARHSQEYEPSDAAGRFRENLDEAGDIVALVAAAQDFDDPEDYLDGLVNALGTLTDFAPDRTLPFLEVLPKELLASDDYKVRNLIKLALASGATDPFYVRREWDKDFIYMKETALTDAVLALHSPEEWQPLATAILRRKPESFDALASLAQAQRALKIISSNRGNPFNPLGEWNYSVMVARLSFAIGNMDGVARARKQVIAFSGEETDYSRMTDLLLLTAKGQVGEAIATTKNREGEWDVWEQSMDYYFGRAAKVAARSLMANGRFGEAGEMIRQGVRAFEMAEMLRELADRLDQEGQPEAAADMRLQADTVETEVRGSWKPSSDDHLAGVARWKKVADHYKFSSGSVESLDQAIKSALNTEHCWSDTKAECIIGSLDYAAGAWGEARMTVAALEKLDPESAVWLPQETRQRYAMARDEALRQIEPTARAALAKWLQEDLSDDERRFKEINDHRIAANAGSAASVKTLISLYDEEEKGLSAQELASLIADGLRHGDRYLHDEVMTGFQDWKKKLRLEFQCVLADEGLYTSGIDGAIGPGTRKAIDALFASNAPAH